jgi:predicted nucleotidyltransferase
MNTQHVAVAEKIARVFSQLPAVQAVAVAGSQTSGMANTESDIDIYVYMTAELSAPRRMAIAAELADDVEVNDFWGPGNEWTDRETGVHVDAVFWTTHWIKDQLDRVLLRNEASMGYTTCFWQTVRLTIR